MKNYKIRKLNSKENFGISLPIKFGKQHNGKQGIIQVTEYGFKFVFID